MRFLDSKLVLCRHNKSYYENFSNEFVLFKFMSDGSASIWFYSFLYRFKCSSISQIWKDSNDFYKNV